MYFVTYVYDNPKQIKKKKKKLYKTSDLKNITVRKTVTAVLVPLSLCLMKDRVMLIRSKTFVSNSMLFIVQWNLVHSNLKIKKFYYELDAP